MTPAALIRWLDDAGHKVRHPTVYALFKRQDTAGEITRALAAQLDAMTEAAPSRESHKRQI